MTLAGLTYIPRPGRASRRRSAGRDTTGAPLGRACNVRPFKEGERFHNQADPRLLPGESRSHRRASAWEERPTAPGYPEGGRTVTGIRHSFPTTLTVAAGLLAATAVRADDWPQWRGPNRDGVCRETGILAAIPESGL